MSAGGSRAVGSTRGFRGGPTDPRGVYLHERTTTTATLGTDTVAVLPTGSVEQHGPALPLGTDLLAARAVAAGVADRSGVAVLPPVPVGVSRHHRQFDGTLWVPDETFADYVGALLDGLADHDVRRAVVVNGHGGNTAALRRTARDLRAADRLFAVPWSWWDGLEDRIATELDTELGHADAVETSLMLHLTDLVERDRLPAAEAGAPARWGERVAGAELPRDATELTDSGAVGSPTDGDAAVGERLLEAAREDLRTLVDWLADQPFAALRPPAHR